MGDLSAPQAACSFHKEQLKQKWEWIHTNLTILVTDEGF